MMNGMELIRKAANDDGDSVLFWRLETREKIIYEVVRYNSVTEHSLTVFFTEVLPDFVFKNFERAVLAAGMEVFKDACLFMEIESGLDEEKGDD